MRNDAAAPLMAVMATAADVADPAVVTIPCRIGERKPLYQHVVQGDDAWLWVDAGIADTPRDFLFPYIDRSGREPPSRQLVVITHADVDHFGGVAALRSRFPGLVAIAHRLDARSIRSVDAVLRERYAVHRAHGLEPDQARRIQLRERAGPPAAVDIEVVGGEVIDLGAAGRWTVLHAPGHTAGHLIVWEPERRVAIVGDAALGWGVAGGNGEPLPPPYYDVPAYRATLDLLAGLGIERLLTSHFPEATGPEVAAFIDESRAAIDAIEEALVSALSAAGDGATLATLCEVVGAELGRWPSRSATALSDPLAAHLADLVGRGEVSVVPDEPWPLYRWQGT